MPMKRASVDQAVVIIYNGFVFKFKFALLIKSIFKERDHLPLFISPLMYMQG